MNNKKSLKTIINGINFDSVVKLLNNGVWEYDIGVANPTLQKEADIKVVLDALKKHEFTDDDVWCSYDELRFAYFVQNECDTACLLSLKSEELLVKFIANDIAKLFVEYDFVFSEEYLDLSNEALLETESDLRKGYILKHVTFYNKPKL